MSRTLKSAIETALAGGPHELDDVDHLMPEMACPHCGERLNMATAVSEEVLPKDGDLTICVFCKGLMIFEKGLRLRKLSNDEESDALDDPRVAAVKNAIRIIRN